MAETRFHALLRERINLRIGDLAESLGEGAADNYSTYQLVVGKIQGLKDALKLCDDIEQDFDQR